MMLKGLFRVVDGNINANPSVDVVIAFTSLLWPATAGDK